MNGEAVLRELVRLQKQSMYPEEGGWLPGVALALTGVLDARKVTPAIRKLERAELVERTKRGHARPTPRGMEVDGILDRITAERGGSFQPRREAGITTPENSALSVLR